jgi:hypothetical protein
MRRGITAAHIGPNGEKVCTLTGTGTVNPNKIRILTWPIHFVRDNWRNSLNAKIALAEDSFPSIALLHGLIIHLKRRKESVGFE